MIKLVDKKINEKNIFFLFFFISLRRLIFFFLRGFNSNEIRADVLKQNQARMYIC